MAREFGHHGYRVWFPWLLKPRMALPDVLSPVPRLLERLGTVGTLERSELQMEPTNVALNKRPPVVPVE